VRRRQRLQWGGSRRRSDAGVLSTVGPPEEPVTVVRSCRGGQPQVRAPRVVRTSSGCVMRGTVDSAMSRSLLAPFARHPRVRARSAPSKARIRFVSRRLSVESGDEVGSSRRSPRAAIAMRPSCCRLVRADRSPRAKARKHQRVAALQTPRACGACREWSRGARSRGRPAPGNDVGSHVGHSSQSAGSRPSPRPSRSQARRRPTLSRGFRVRLPGVGTRGCFVFAAARSQADKGGANRNRSKDGGIRHPLAEWAGQSLCRRLPVTEKESP
jgi:hypothetical protein